MYRQIIFFIFSNVDSPSGLFLFDHLRSVFLSYYNISIWQYYKISCYMVMKKFLQIFLIFIFWSYATSCATLHTAIMRSSEFNRVQFLSLLHSTLIARESAERFETSSSPLFLIFNQQNYNVQLCWKEDCDSRANEFESLPFYIPDIRFLLLTKNFL